MTTMKIEMGVSFAVPGLNLLNDSKSLVMLWVSPGIFTMGSPVDEPGHAYEDGLPFKAHLSKGFWLGKYPVTQKQWQSVMDHNPSYFRGNENPVENISWYEALDFCQKLNIKISYALPQGYEFSVPTQMQWEYACRAGTQNLYSVGNNIDDLLRTAWCAGNSGGKTHPIGEKAQNDWGFHDMLGNVLEWCYDSGEDYPTDLSTDWVGSMDEQIRVLRGGDWSLNCTPTNIRCSIAYHEKPSRKEASIGFRLCLRSTN